MTRLIVLACGVMMTVGAVLSVIYVFHHHGWAVVLDVACAAWDAYYAAFAARYVLRGLLSPDTTVCVLGRTGGDR